MAFQKGNKICVGRKMSKKTRIALLKSNLGSKHSEETKRKIALSRMGDKNWAKRPEVRKKISEKAKLRVGEKNPNWKGGITGITSERVKFYSSLEYKQWRAKVFQRDNWICQTCHKKSEGDLEAHHIKSWKDFSELRFDLDNGITLCEKCHSLTPNYKNRK